MRYDDIEADVIHSVEVKRDGRFPDLEALRALAQGEKEAGEKYGKQNQAYWKLMHRTVRDIWLKEPKRNKFIVPWGRMDQVGPNT